MLAHDYTNLVRIFFASPGHWTSSGLDGHGPLTDVRQLGQVAKLVKRQSIPGIGQDPLGQTRIQEQMLRFATIRAGTRDYVVGLLTDGGRVTVPRSRQ
jgi:hypothetical protein